MAFGMNRDRLVNTLERALKWGITYPKTPFSLGQSHLALSLQWHVDFPQDIKEELLAQTFEVMSLC